MSKAKCNLTKVQMQTNQPNFPPNAISTKKNTIILTRKHGKGKRATHEQEARSKASKQKKMTHK